MGYESRVYIINRNRVSKYGEIIAMFNCRYMGQDFKDLFQTEIDFRAYHEDGNTQIKLDDYGYVCKYAYAEDVQEWLKHKIKEEKRTVGGCYRRLKPLYKLLKTFNNKHWNYSDNEMLVLHYGY